MSFTRNDIRDAVTTRLGLRTDLETVTELEIRFAQNQLEQERVLPWFLLSRRASVSTVADTEKISVPSDFLREYDEGGQKGSLEIQDTTDSNWYELRKLPAGDLDAEFGNVEAARPEAYALVGHKFIFGPVPDGIYTIRIRTYYSKAIELTSDISNDWTTYGADLLIATTGKRMAYGYVKDMETQAYFDQMYSEAFARMIADSTAREEAGIIRPLNEAYP